MHIKRKTVQDFWPIAKTGTKYLVVPLHNQYNSVPLIIFIRNVLGLVKNMKEMEKILREKKIVVNGKIITEPNFPVAFGDSISIPSTKSHFKIGLKGRRFELVPVSEKESETKISKIIGKKLLPGKKVQVNLENGKNIISSEKMKTGDFVVLNNKDNKIQKIIALEKGSEVVITKGKHCGKEGKILEMLREGENQIIQIKTKTEEIKVNIDSAYAK